METEKTYFRSGINFIELGGTRRKTDRNVSVELSKQFRKFCSKKIFWESEKMRLVQFGELQLDIFQPGGGIDGQRNMA